MQINDVYQIDYTKQTQSFESEKIDASNCASIFTKDNKSNATTENNIDTTINKILEEICEKYKQYNLTVDDLKKNPAIQKACKLQEEDINILCSEKKLRLINTFKAAIEAAINDSVVNGKIDIDKVAKLSNDYFVALSTGWTIEGLKEQNKKYGKTSLIDRLKLDGSLDKNATIENTSPEKLQEAIKKYFAESLTGAVSKNFKTKEEALKAQLQTFGRILINSSEEEKKYFAKALEYLYNENKLPGLKAIVSSCNEDKTVQEILVQVTAPNSNIMTTADADGNYPSIETSTAFNTYSYSHLSEENASKVHESNQEYRENWFKDNKDNLNDIKALRAKIDEANANGTELKLSENEQELLKILIEYENKINAGSAGEFIGLSINSRISSEFKKQHLNLLNSDAQKLPNYEEVLNTIDEYIKSNPDNFSEETLSALEKVLNKATNDNYAKVSRKNSAKREEKGTTDIANTKSESEYNEALSNVKTLKTQIFNNSFNYDNNKFTVEKNTTSDDIEIQTSNISTEKTKALQNANHISNYLKISGKSEFDFLTDIFSNYGSVGQSVKLWAKMKLDETSNTMLKLLLNSEPVKNSYYGMIAFAKKFDLSKYDLNLSAPIERVVNKIQEQKV